MKKFNTITTAELFDKNIARTPFIVEEILPRGLTILGGLGKVGKSWVGNARQRFSGVYL